MFLLPGMIITLYTSGTLGTVLRCVCMGGHGLPPAFALVMRVR